MAEKDDKQYWPGPTTPPKDGEEVVEPTGGDGGGTAEADPAKAWPGPTSPDPDSES